MVDPLDTYLFDLRGFEQGLDQMNRLTSVDAKLQLQPGDTPGGSFVIVERAQADRFRGRAQFDTLGSDVNGRLRVTLGVELDDALGLNDAWAASLSGTANSNAIKKQSRPSESSHCSFDCARMVPDTNTAGRPANRNSPANCLN